MTEYLTEQEQIEILKNWIKQYSVVILAGIAISVAIVTGWRYWQDRETNILNHASILYDEMLMTRAQNDSVAALSEAQKLFQDYPRTIYGQMAAFMLARDAISKKNFAQAEKNLQWVIDRSYVAPFRQIARLRLARVFIAEQNPQAAIKILSTIEDKSFNGLIDEVKGDAYLAMKNVKAAQDAYSLALKELPNAEVLRPLLQMKYDNLTTTIPTS